MTRFWKEIWMVLPRSLSGRSWAFSLPSWANGLSVICFDSRPLNFASFLTPHLANQETEEQRVGNSYRYHLGPKKEECRPVYRTRGYEFCILCCFLRLFDLLVDTPGQ